MRYSRPLAVFQSSALFSRRLARIARSGLVLGAFMLGLPPVAARAADPPPATTRTFDVEAYDVDGVKLLKEVEVETAVYPYMGPGRTAAEIDKAREALEKVYHDRGFQTVVVELPAQTVADNVVRLHVIEAPVGRLRVTGSHFFSPDFVRREAPTFAENQVPDINEGQKELAAINRLPDRRVTPVLRAGEVPGTVDVDLKVSDSLPLHGSLELNNDHNQGTPPLRLAATGHYDNLWQLGHSLSFTYSVAPEDRAASEIYAGSYLAPVWGTPWSILAYGYKSNSNVAALGGTNVLGKGYAIGMKGIIQLPIQGDLSQSLNFGVDFKHFDENINVASTSTADTVEYWPINLAYSAQRDGPRFGTKLSLTLNVGVRGPGSDTAQYEFKRFNATPNWVHLNLDLTQTEALPHGLELAQRLTGQLTDQPLVSSEEFAAGGLSSVRGYLQSEATGDDGFSGSLELRSPSLATRFGALVDELRFYAFADGAVVTTKYPLPGQKSDFDLASSGVGMRVELFKHFKGDLAGAMPLIAGPSTSTDHPRLTFSVKSEF